MFIAAASLASDPGKVDLVAAASPAATATKTSSAAALATTKPGDASRYFVPGAARTYSTPVPTPTPTPTPPPGSCGDLLIHISKTIGISGNCIPANLQEVPQQYSYLLEDPVLLLRSDALSALVEMLDVATGNGLYIVVRSAYRNYQHQAYLFDYWVNLLGYEEALRTSAPPGHSEHQLGTAVDLTSYTNSYGLDGFEQTAEGQWLAQYSYLFGFVLSYPPGTEHVTGYAYEPWHFRYIGHKDAKAMHDRGLTLHDYTAQR